MATKFIDVEGENQLAKFLTGLDVEVRKVVAKEINRIAIDAKNHAKRLAPVDSGELKKGIKVTRRARQGRLSARISAKAPHAHLVEFGHMGPSGHVFPIPFMGPARLRAGNKAGDRIRQAVSRGILAAKAKHGG